MKKTINATFRILGMLGLFIALLTPMKTSAHAVQVGYCQLSNGYIRIYIEHWHGNLSGPSSAGTMNITTTYGTTTVTQNLTPTGVINNTTYNNLSGCGSSINIISQCTGSFRPANSQNDWVYYDFAPAVCGVDVTIRLNAGNTVVLREGCSNLYPATVTARFNDNAPPILTCPSDIVVEACGPTNVNFAATATDACDPNPTITYSKNPGTTFPMGVTQVTATATDNKSQSSTCTFNVTVRDATNPTISCAGDKTISTDDDICGATINGTSCDPTTSDNCSVASVVNDYTGTSSLNGAVFPVGSTPVVWVVTDASGNVATCTDTITVKDETDPIIEGENNNITMNFDAGRGNPISYTEAGITFLSLYGNSSHVHLGDNDRDGSNDLLNHSGCCSTPYRLTVGSNVQYTLVSMEVKQLSGTATFSVYPSGASVTIGSTGTFTFPSGFEDVTEVRWHQSSGRMTIDNMVVSTKTSGSCPSDITVENTTDTCGANVTYSADVTDNCPGASLAFSPVSGSFFNVGTTVVTATATDAAGNTSSCNFNVTVEDTQDPEVSCNGNHLKSADQGVCSYTANGTEFDASASDNCGVETLVNNFNNSNSLGGASFPVGSTTVVWTATDSAGNTSSCSQIITVNDTQDPTISCAASSTKSTDAGLCSYAVQGSEFDPTTGDNCGVASVTNDYNNSASLASAVFNHGSTTVTWTVTDDAGNTATCSHVVTVEDNEDPEANCQNASVTLSAGSASITTTDINLNSTDNCGISAYDLDVLDFDCGDIGANTVNLTVTDNSGNTNTCASTVTVIGAIPSCSISSSANSSGTVIGSLTTYAATNQMFLGYGAQSMNITCSASGGSSFSYSWTGSGLSSTSISNPVFTPTSAGNYVLECTVTNNYGCETTCSVTICVIDVTSSKGSKKKPKVIICHVPKGNPTNTQTLSISVNAVSTHLGLHGGCSLGPCGSSCDDNKLKKRSAPGEMHHIVRGENDLDLAVYPNPSSSEFNFILESPYDELLSLQIFDINGRLLIEESGISANDEHSFGEHLQNGVYIAVISQGSYSKKLRLIKGN